MTEFRGTLRGFLVASLLEQRAFQIGKEERIHALTDLRSWRFNPDKTETTESDKYKSSLDILWITTKLIPLNLCDYFIELSPFLLNTVRK